MKALRNILAILSAIFLLLTVVTPFICSKMQDYYKSFPVEEWSQELLDKKKFWVQLGESNVFLYIFVAFTCAYLIAVLVMYLRKHFFE